MRDCPEVRVMRLDHLIGGRIAIRELTGITHRVAAARGNDPPRREHTVDVPVLRERALDQRRPHARRPEQAAVGFKLSDGMEVPAELGSFKFARQKSKLAGTMTYGDGGT